MIKRVQVLPFSILIRNFFYIHNNFLKINNTSIHHIQYKTDLKISEWNYKFWITVEGPEIEDTVENEGCGRFSYHTHFLTKILFKYIHTSRRSDSNPLS